MASGDNNKNFKSNNNTKLNFKAGQLRGLILNTSNKDSLLVKYRLSEKRSIDRAWEMLDKLVKLCQHPRMNLKHSPPYILDILPDIYLQMKQIQSVYMNKWDDLIGIEYFGVFMINLHDKSEKCMELFSNNSYNIYVEDSFGRNCLTRFSLIFSHMLAELKALFPNGTYAEHNYRVTKNEASDWWKSTFRRRTLIPWKEFKNALNQVHRIGTCKEADALKTTLDLSCDDHVSIFEFDIFTRLFQPWRTLLRNWNVLAVTHPGYVAFMTYDEVKVMLTNFKDKPGSYVFRLSCTRLGQWAIGYVTKGNEILQTIPQNKSLGQALMDGQKEKYYLYPAGQPINPNVQQLVEDAHGDHIKVSEEQYELYCEMGSTFQLCKICAENDKDVRIEPCGHLMCQACLTHWQTHSGLCPFCRSEIKGTQKVIVDPFNPSKHIDVPLTSPKSQTTKNKGVGNGGGVEGSGEEDDDDEEGGNLPLVVFLKEQKHLQEQKSHSTTTTATPAGQVSHHSHHRNTTTTTNNAPITTNHNTNSSSSSNSKHHNVATITTTTTNNNINNPCGGGGSGGGGGNVSRSSSYSVKGLKDLVPPVPARQPSPATSPNHSPIIARRVPPPPIDNNNNNNNNNHNNNNNNNISNTTAHGSVDDCFILDSKRISLLRNKSMNQHLTSPSNRNTALPLYPLALPGFSLQPITAYTDDNHPPPPPIPARRVIPYSSSSSSSSSSSHFALSSSLSQPPLPPPTSSSSSSSSLLSSPHQPLTSSASHQPSSCQVTPLIPLPSSTSSSSSSPPSSSSSASSSSSSQHSPPLPPPPPSSSSPPQQLSTSSASSSQHSSSGNRVLPNCPPIITTTASNNNNNNNNNNNK